MYTFSLNIILLHYMNLMYCFHYLRIQMFEAISVNPSLVYGLFKV